MTLKRVLVIGAGPAGLAAATRLLEVSPRRFSVKLIHMGHNLGGKAASCSDTEGRTVEHGWHMIVGFYQNLRALMRRAGIEESRILASMGGKSHVYESFDGRVHTIDSNRGRFGFGFHFLGYSGMRLGERLNYGRFMAQAYLRAFTREDLSRHDDICFSAWAIEHGLRPHLTRFSLFRFFREAYFNYPEEISAYHVLQTLRLMSSSRTAELFVVKGGFSREVWAPIAAYLVHLGGTIEPFTLATDWIYEGDRIVGVRAGAPDGSDHRCYKGAWKRPAIAIKRGTERVVRDFDHVISTIPHAVFLGMNRRDERLWAAPYFRPLKNIRSGSTLSMTVLLGSRYLPLPGPVFGFPAPLGIVVNMKPYWKEYRENPAIGAALHFVGQELGFEAWSDQQIIQFTLDNCSRVQQLGAIRKADILEIEFHRNRADHERLVLCEPGIQQFRPSPRTPFSNLLLAGDWVRNPIDLICMEAAVTSGIEAADLLIAGS